MPRRSREPAGSDDDDSVSVTSSLPDELNDGAEYEVETILAEKKVPRRGTFFLIRWKDYALEESTWEPESNLGSELMADWVRKQYLQDSGKTPPFDLDDFEQRSKVYNAGKERRVQEKAEKKVRRRRKKKHLGLAVSPSAEPEPEHQKQQSSSDEAVEDNEIDDVGSVSQAKSKANTGKTPPRRRLERLEQSIDSSSEDEPLFKVQQKMQAGTSILPEHNDPELAWDPRVDSSPQTSPSERQANSSKHRELTSSPDEPIAQSFKKAPPIVRNPIGAATSAETFQISKRKVTATSSSKKSTVRTTANKVVRPAPLPAPPSRLPIGRGGATAVRGGLRNVFASLQSASKRPRPNLLANSSDIAKTPKLYTNKRLERKAVLQGRERADAAPDVGRLGGLYDPSKPDQYRAMRPTIAVEPTSKSSFESQQNESRRDLDLFVPQYDPPTAEGEAPDGPPVWEQGHPDSQMRHETCYYWHKNQQGSSSRCSRGNYCFYYHQYRPNMSIAAAPPSDAALSKTRYTCYFWHAAQIDHRAPCTKDPCVYLHSYEEGVPILDPPLSHRPLPPLDEVAHAQSTGPRTCYFWHMSNSNTRFSCNKDPCLFRHSYEKGVPVADAPPDSVFSPGLEGYKRPRLPRVQPNGRPAWDPYNPLNAICWYWANDERCERSGTGCKLYHSNDARLPLAPSSQEQAKIFEMTPCKFFFNRNDCKWGPVCKYSHSAESPFIADRSAMAQPESPSSYNEDHPISNDSYTLSADPKPSYASTNIETGSSLSKASQSSAKKTVSFENATPESGLSALLHKFAEDLFNKLAEDFDNGKAAKVSNGEPKQISSSLDSNMIRQGDLRKIIPPGYWKPRKEGSRPMNPNFFLFFPSEGRAAADSLIAGIKVTHPSSNFSDSEDPQSWEKFIGNPEMCGIVLVYQNRFLHLLQLPYLLGALNSGSFTFWFISDNRPPKRLPFYSSYWLHDPESMIVGSITATRLLPHGGAILLTPSFLAAEPEQTYRFLRWFLGSTREKHGKHHPKYLSTTVGTWKLVVCHDFVKYYERLGHCKVREKDRYEVLYKDNPAKEAKLETLRLSYAKCDLRFRTLFLLSDFENRRYEINPLTANFHRYSDSPDAAHPITLVPPYIDHDDEKAIVSWFGAWSTSKLDMHRKFFVLGTGSSSQTYASRLPWVSREDYDAQLGAQEALDLAANQVAADQAFDTGKRKSTATRGDMTDSASLETALKVSLSLPSKPITKAGSNNEKLNPKDAQKQRALAIAAKLSGSSPSKDVTLVNSAEKNVSTIAPSEASADELEGGIMDMIHRESVRSSTTNKLPPLQTTIPATMGSFPSPAAPFPGNTSRRGSLNHSASPLNTFSPQFNPLDSRPGSAKSTSSSNAGIASDQIGNRFVPRSVRHDNSIRNERPVRPGFVPKEDEAQRYRIPARRESANLSSSRENSRRGSLAGIGAGVDSAVPIIGVTDLMDIDVDASATAAEDVDMMDIDTDLETSSEKTRLEDGKRKLKEKVQITGMIHYEPTIEWWKRERQEGNKRFLWEHIFVDGWESVFKKLNIDANKPL